MSHNVVAVPVWWPNGSLGREIRCETCNRVLWQSAPDVPHDASEALVASIRKAHQEETKPVPEVVKKPEPETAVASRPPPEERAQ